MKKTMAAVVVLAVMAVDAQAEVVRYAFVGSVVKATRGSNLSADIQIGTPVSGEFSYNLGSPQEILEESVFGYRQVGESPIAIDIAGVEIISFGEFIAAVVDNELAPNLRDYVFSVSDGAVLGLEPSGLGPPLTGDEVVVDGGLVTGSIAFLFGDTLSTTRGPSPDLPPAGSLLTLPKAAGHVKLFLDDPVGGENLINISFEIDSLRLVPEPGGLWMVACAFLASACSRGAFAAVRFRFAASHPTSYELRSLLPGVGG